MGALTNLSDLVNRATGGNSGTPESLFFYKLPRIAGAAATVPIAGRWQTLWTFDGSQGPGAAATGAAVYPDNTTNGGIKQTDPSGGRQKWLVSASVTGATTGTLLIYDRLAQYGGLSGTTTGDQFVNLTPTRYTDGIGNFAFIEIQTQIGASSTTVKLKYRDQGAVDDNYGPLVIIGNTNYREATRAIWLPVGSGDYGIEKLQAINLTATTSTAGDMAAVLGHPIAYLPVPLAGAGELLNFVDDYPGPIEIKTDACLAALWLPTAATAPEVFCTLNTVEA